MGASAFPPPPTQTLNHLEVKPSLEPRGCQRYAPRCYQRYATGATKDGPRSTKISKRSEDASEGNNLAVRYVVQEIDEAIKGPISRYISFEAKRSEH